MVKRVRAADRRHTGRDRSRILPDRDRPWSDATNRTTSRAVAATGERRLRARRIAAYAAIVGHGGATAAPTGARRRRCRSAAVTAVPR
jgi:hypothetical protein